MNELKRVVQFLDQEFTPEIEKCILNDSKGPFQRTKRPKLETEKILSKITKPHLNLYERSYQEMVEALEIKFSNS